MMSMAVNRSLLMGAGSVALLALFANIIAIATPNWVSGSMHRKGVGTILVHNGLWRGCAMLVGSATSYTCFSRDHNPKIDAIRAMSIIAMLCGLVTLTVVVALLFAEKVAGVGMRVPNVTKQRNAGVVSSAVGGVCMLACIVIYSWYFNQTYIDDTYDIHMGYSFYMALCALAMYVVGSVLVRFSVVGAAAEGVVLLAPGSVATHGAVYATGKPGIVNPAGPV